MLKRKGIIIATVVLLIAIYILNIIDYLQTAYAIQILGIGVELNPIGRFCFEHNCALPVKLIGILIILIMVGFITIMIEPKYICVSFMLFVFYVAVVWHNFVQLEQAGILNFNQLEEKMMTTIAIVCAIVTTVSAIATGALCAYYKYLKKK